MHMEESRNADRILLGRPVGKRSLEKLRYRWQDNIKMDFKVLGYDARN